MKIKILAFGIAKDIFGASSIEIEAGNDTDVQALKTILEQRYDKLKQLATYFVAVNNEYAANETVINANDEIAIIPPVSGG